MHWQYPEIYRLLSCSDYADIAFLQVFLWGYFGPLSLNPTQYPALEMVGLEESGQIFERPDRSYQPMRPEMVGLK